VKQTLGLRDAGLLWRLYGVPNRRGVQIEPLLTSATLTTHAGLGAAAIGTSVDHTLLGGESASDCQTVAAHLAAPSGPTAGFVTKAAGEALVAQRDLAQRRRFGAVPMKPI